MHEHIKPSMFDCDLPNIDLSDFFKSTEDFSLSTSGLLLRDNIFSCWYFFSNCTTEGASNNSYKINKNSKTIL